MISKDEFCDFLDFGKIRHDISCKLFAEDSQELSSCIFLEFFTASVICCSLDLMFGLSFMFHLC